MSKAINVHKEVTQMLYGFTMDSFGDFCPANWEEIAAFLNDKIEAIIAEYGENAEHERGCKDRVIQVWEDYCNGAFPDAPHTANVDINGVLYTHF